LEAARRTEGVVDERISEARRRQGERQHGARRFVTEDELGADAARARERIVERHAQRHLGRDLGR
jgi:hypothetical protein